MSEMIGRVLEGYRIDAELGRGGQAVVYRATQLSLQRTVALKVVSSALSSDTNFKERFTREGIAAASLDHPHVIPVFEAGEAEGLAFLAMKFIDGPSFDRVLHEPGGIPPRRTLSILLQTAEALDYVAARDMVHRDVKPANILLGPGDHAYLSDFGLIKAISASKLTSSGVWMGTLEYVAPEQIRGGEITPAADRYALAAVAFEALTGRPVFPRDDRTATLFAHVSDPPPAASSLNPALGPEVDAVLTRGLAKDPADRYPTAVEFVNALSAAVMATPGAADARPPLAAPAPPPPPVVPAGATVVDAPATVPPEPAPTPPPPPAAPVPPPPPAEAVSASSGSGAAGTVTGAPSDPAGTAPDAAPSDPGSPAGDGTPSDPGTAAGGDASSASGATVAGDTPSASGAAAPPPGDGDGAPGTPRSRRKPALIAGGAAAAIVAIVVIVMAATGAFGGGGKTTTTYVLDPAARMVTSPTGDVIGSVVPSELAGWSVEPAPAYLPGLETPPGAEHEAASFSRGTDVALVAGVRPTNGDPVATLRALDEQLEGTAEPTPELGAGALGAFAKTVVDGAAVAVALDDRVLLVLAADTAIATELASSLVAAD